MCIVYDQICYGYCYFLGVFVEIVNNDKFYNCCVMFNGYCIKCFYSYSEYMYIIYKIIFIEMEFLFKKVQSFIIMKEDMKFQKEVFINMLKLQSIEYK